MPISDAAFRLPVALLALAALAACGQSPSDAMADADAKTGGDDSIACRVGGADSFEKVCGVERSAAADGLVLTIRHPDGSFRRLLATKDGRGVIAADGAEQAKVTLTNGNEIEVALAGDRYRLPATVKGWAPSAP